MFNISYPWKRKFFIDCGGHNGSSVRKFRNEIDRNNQFDIFTFEPNPEFSHHYSQFLRHNLLPYAVWIEDGEQNFFLDHEDGDGSTLIREKLTKEEGGIGQLDKDSPLRVKSIDLSSWLRRNFKKNDYIIVKLDIEGAEYKVLDKLCQDGTINYINQLFIEWHWFKIGVPESTHQTLVKKINSLGIPVTEWDARET
jgi:FkbM family methyltransferase